MNDVSNIDYWMKPENIKKNLTPLALFDAVLRVPGGYVLVKNQVGNLSIVDPETQKYLGFIDLRTGEVDLEE